MELVSFRFNRTNSYLVCSVTVLVQFKVTAVRAFGGTMLAKFSFPLELIKLKAEP
jgi:hypothetical protein